jgi:hypothetical protein
VDPNHRRQAYLGQVSVPSSSDTYGVSHANHAPRFIDGRGLREQHAEED